ncbi:MAG: hypothetical protein C4523_08300 [Myxococcales bacterium]|nr:MAG: hypothetical protein C4523_08300 [Myxococcales bacterium]
MRRFARFVVALAAVSIAALGCERGPNEEEDAQRRAQAELKVLDKLQISEKSENVLFTYMDQSQNYQTVPKAEDVPDPFRNDVIVVDLKLPPEQRLAETKVIVADLNVRDENGDFKLRIEDRAAFEKALALKRQWRLTPTPDRLAQIDPAKMQQLARQAAQPSDKIVLYSTSWCGYCRKVRELFKAKGVPFIERDIEKDDEAATEMQIRCAQAKAQCGGVPVVDWKGTIIPGYDEPTLQRLIAALSAAVPAPAPPAAPGP